RRGARLARGRGPVSIAGYPGPAGSHSAAAALLLAPEATQEPLASFIAVAEAAVAGEVTLGVLPIENSLHGPVAETHDLLYEAPIASAEAASRYGLHVIAPDVGDHTAFTRFVGIAPYTLVSRAPRWRTALSFVTDHQPGSLYHALGPFHKHGLNLVQLVSRPIPQSTFRYRFDLVLDGHPQDVELRAALVEMREWTREVRIFGSYAATGDH